MRKLGLEFFLYFVASLLALGCDIGLLLMLAGYMHYMLAATISFFVGSLIHYWLSVILVFKSRRMADKRAAEGTIFVSAGVFGLLINAGVIAVSVEMYDLPLAYAKLFAAGFSFIAGYLARKMMLFR